MSANPRSRGRATLASYTLDNLLRGAAQLDPNGAALAGHMRRDGESQPVNLTFGGLDAEADRAARRLVALGLAPGESVILVAGAEPAGLIALIGALRAGLAVTLASAGLCTPSLGTSRLDAPGLAQFAAETAPAGLLVAGDVSRASPFEPLFALAAQCDFVRCVASLGARPDANVAALEEIEEAPAAELRGRAQFGALATRAHGDGRLVAHEPARLAAAALDYIARVEPDGRAAFFSTLAPTSLGGLVAGPLAAILSGSPLVMSGRFEPEAFLTALDAAGRVHLVAPAALGPAALGPAVVRAGLAAPGRCASLTLVTRHADGRACLAAGRPADISGSDPLHRRDEATLPDATLAFDLHTIGEDVAFARPRAKARALHPYSPLAQYIDVDGEMTLACEMRPGTGGGLDMRGASVEGGDVWRPV